MKKGAVFLFFAASILALIGGIWSGAPTAAQGSPPGYDIVYVRQPRNGDDNHITWPEVFHPGRIEPGSDLMLLHPDGSEEASCSGRNGWS